MLLSKKDDVASLVAQFESIVQAERKRFIGSHSGSLGWLKRWIQPDLGLSFCSGHMFSTTHATQFMFGADFNAASLHDAGRVLARYCLILDGVFHPTSGVECFPADSLGVVMSSRGCVLEPVMWETHSTPEFGSRPQAALNRQLVDTCDALVGTFWTRIGSPTGEAPSGTIEEINRVTAAKKPVMLYFSSRPVDPNAVDTEQLDALRGFKASCRALGLFDEYQSPEQLSKKLNLGLTRLAERLLETELERQGELGAHVSRPSPAAQQVSTSTGDKWTLILKDALGKATTLAIDSAVQVELPTPDIAGNPVRQTTRLAGPVRVSSVSNDSFVLGIQLAGAAGITSVAIPFGQTEDIWLGSEGHVHVMLRRAIVRSEGGTNLR